MRSEKLVIVVSGKEFPTKEAAKTEACRYAIAGVTHAISASVLGIRQTRFLELRWYVTVNVYKR